MTKIGTLSISDTNLAKTTYFSNIGKQKEEVTGDNKSNDNFNPTYQDEKNDKIHRLEATQTDRKACISGDLYYLIHNCREIEREIKSSSSYEKVEGIEREISWQIKRLEEFQKSELEFIEERREMEGKIKEVKSMLNNFTEKVIEGSSKGSNLLKNSRSEFKDEDRISTRRTTGRVVNNGVNSPMSNTNLNDCQTNNYHFMNKMQSNTSPFKRGISPIDPINPFWDYANYESSNNMSSLNQNPEGLETYYNDFILGKITFQEFAHLRYLNEIKSNHHIPKDSINPSNSNNPNNQNQSHSSRKNKSLNNSDSNTINTLFNTKKFEEAKLFWKSYNYTPLKGISLERSYNMLNIILKLSDKETDYIKDLLRLNNSNINDVTQKDDEIVELFAEIESYKKELLALENKTPLIKQNFESKLDLIAKENGVLYKENIRLKTIMHQDNLLRSLNFN